MGRCAPRVLTTTNNAGARGYNGPVSDTAMRVPAGHTVQMYWASPEPNVSRSDGGVVLAHLGSAGDDPDRELESILAALGEAVRTDVAPTFLVNNQRTLSLSDLFAPAEPSVDRVMSPVIWTFHHGGAASLCTDSRRVDLVVARMRELATRGVVQTVFVEDPPARAAAPLFERVHELGLSFRRPDTTQEPATILLEVQRPDGTIVCAWAGKPAERTFEKSPGPVMPLRSPRLAPIILDRNRTDNTELLEVLRARTLPLLLMVDAKTGRPPLRGWGNVTAVPAYSDLPSLELAARELGWKPGTFPVAMVDVGALFAQAAAQRIGIAICAYRGDTPVYVLLPSA